MDASRQAAALEAGVKQGHAEAVRIRAGMGSLAPTIVSRGVRSRRSNALSALQLHAFRLRTCGRGSVT